MSILIAGRLDVYFQSFLMSTFCTVLQNLTFERQRTIPFTINNTL